MLAVLVSHEFAYGRGSGHISGDINGHVLVFLRNLRVMFPHTIAGSVAIVVGQAQFNSTLQFKYPMIHRYLGRLYFLCAMIICWSTASFLIDTIPTNEVFSGRPFALILSMLGFAVFTTMLCAIYAIWNGDIGSHREFMTLNYSYMLSAPMLRVAGITLGQFWGTTKFIINLY